MPKGKHHCSKAHIPIYGPELRKSGKIKDYTGVDLGLVIVVKHVGFNYLRNAVYLCRDVFGAEFLCSAHCFNASKRYNFKTRVWTAESKKKTLQLYYCYTNMIQRCYDPQCAASKYYMQKGVTVCNEWRNEEGYTNFIKWAAASGFCLGLTLDKKDNIYSPETCRWITKSENSRYTSRTRLNEHKVREIRASFKKFDGRKTDFYILKAKEYGVSAAAVESVVYNHNWVGV